MKKRIVVTGLGAITPIGNNVKDFWGNAKNGSNGIDEITLFNTDDFKVKMAAEVKDFNVEEYLDKKASKRMDRYTQFAMIAAKEAINE